MGECANLGQGCTACTDRYDPREHNSPIWDVLWLCKVRAQVCKLRAWSEHVQEELCIIRVLGMTLVVRNQRRIKEDALRVWKESGAKDRLEQAGCWLCKEVKGTMYLVWYVGRYKGALQQPIRRQSPPWPDSNEPITQQQEHSQWETKTSSTLHLIHPFFKSIMSH